MKQRALQDEIPDNFCYGCGASNHQGLQIKSYWDGDETICTFKPSPHYMAGPRQFLNGGIIATLIDCHCICTAIANAYRKEGRAIGSKPAIWFVTAALKVNYLKPTPIEQPVFLRARIGEDSARKTITTCSLYAGGEECARGEVVAVRVTPFWKESATK